MLNVLNVANLVEPLIWKPALEGLHYAVEPNGRVVSPELCAELPSNAYSSRDLTV
jgi:hypothetical protein